MSAQLSAANEAYAAQLNALRVAQQDDPELILDPDERERAQHELQNIYNDTTKAWNALIEAQAAYEAANLAAEWEAMSV